MRVKEVGSGGKEAKKECTVAKKRTEREAKKRASDKKKEAEKSCEGTG